MEGIENQDEIELLKIAHGIVDIPHSKQHALRDLKNEELEMKNRKKEKKRVKKEKEKN